MREMRDQGVVRHERIQGKVVIENPDLTGRLPILDDKEDGLICMCRS
jgi:hypothetical protein